MKTDSQRQPDVMAELTWEPAVHAAQIGVEVKQGVVTLAGEMRVQLSEIGKRTDAVKADIEAALKRRATADAKPIAVDVKGADVTLTGTVHSWAERDLATRSAWGSPGVRSVVDKMNLVH